MKKNLLMLSICGLSIMANAQNRSQVTVSGQFANKPVVTSRAATLNDNAIPFVKHNATTAAVNKKTGGSYGVNFIGQEAIIGNTDYDLQSNSSSYPRLVKNSDGTMSAAWTYYPDGSTTTDRGTGYNYFNGTSWGPAPSARIEGAKRTGFTNMVVTGSNQELCFAHSSTDGVVLISKRPAKGTGAWTYDNTSLTTAGATNTDTWSRAIAGGANGLSIHEIVNDNTQGNAGGNIIYSRSTDDGNTWGPNRVSIPGMTDVDYPYYIGGDAYAIATNGDNVAIVLGDITTDVALFKSTDNGLTWAKTQVTNQWAGGSFNPDGNISDIDGDLIADTVETTGGDLSVFIDNSGVCHVTWGTMRMLDDSAAIGYTNFNVFLGTNGINYWHEGMPAPVFAAGAEDWNGNGSIDIPTYPADPNELGWGRYGNMGLACVPSAAMDGAGNIYIAFQAINELADTALYGKAHYQIYVTASTDGGNTWSIPHNVITAGQNADSLFFEGCYPSMAKVVDNNVYIEYERDYIPGLFWGATAGSVDAVANDPLNNINDIVVATIPITDLVGINELTANQNTFTVSQNNPNPSKGTTFINIGLAKTADVKVEVTNLTGQVLFTNAQSKLAPGTHALSLNTNDYAPGVYFYSVTVEGEKVTKKMIVE